LRCILDKNELEFNIEIPLLFAQATLLGWTQDKHHHAVWSILTTDEKTCMFKCIYDDKHEPHFYPVSKDETIFMNHEITDDMDKSEIIKFLMNGAKQIGNDNSQRAIWRKNKKNFQVIYDNHDNFSIVPFNDPIPQKLDKPIPWKYK
jgi:hypothetical protein